MRGAVSGVLGAALCVVSGCAASPPLLPTVEPAANPYALPLLPKDPEGGAAQVERVAGWSDAEHVRAVDRIVGPEVSEVLSFGAAGGRVELRGPELYVRVARRFLTDRVTYRAAFVELDAQLLSVLPADLPRLGGLTPLPDGGAWAALSSQEGGDPFGWREGRRIMAPRVTLADGETGHVDVGERASVTRVQVRNGTRVGDPSSAGVVLSGARLALTPALAADDLLVLALRLEHAAESAGPLALRLEDATDAHMIHLPRVRRVLGSARLTLRRGETLWLVHPDPGTGRALVLQLAWSRTSG